MALSRPYYMDVRGYRVPGAFSKRLVESALDYKARDDDVFLCAYPKSGSTWTQVILILILNKGKNVLKSYDDLNSYSAFIELTGSEMVEHSMKRPGVVKCQFPYHLAPYNPKAKYVTIARNPRDSCVSFFHHSRTPIYNFADGTFDEYFEIFVNGQNDFGDYFDHFLSWWEHRNDPNVLFVTYEELKSDTENVVRRFAKFLGPEYEEALKDEDVMKNILKFSSIEYMKEFVGPSIEWIFQLEAPPIDENSPEWLKEIAGCIEDTIKKLNPVKGEHEHHFVRKGKIGDWKNHFSDEQIKRLNRKFAEKIKGKDVEELLNIWRKHGCIDF